MKTTTDETTRPALCLVQPAPADRDSFQSFDSGVQSLLLRGDVFPTNLDGCRPNQLVLPPGDFGLNCYFVFAGWGAARRARAILPASSPAATGCKRKL